MSNAALRIMIVEDEPAHAEAIRRAFEEAGMGDDISMAATLEEYRAGIISHAPDVALMDLNLPDGRAVEVLRLPPEDGPFPILIMTSFGNEQVAVEALKSGALDYVVKSPEAFAAMPRTVPRVLREWNLLQERKRAEEELRRAKDELEIRVRERTRELERAYNDLRLESEHRISAVEDLRRKEQLLLQQNRLAAMGEMIGNIAHQWRQPLNTLGLLVQELPVIYQKGELSTEYLQESKEKAMKLIGAMSRTIDDFRNFFRPDKEKASFRANEVIRTTISLLQASFDNEQIEVSVQEEDVVIEGYPNELSQVILNILINAKDAFLERSTENAQILVSTFRENGKPVITISDNAGGIPEEIMGKIFEPYFTTKGPNKGTGIGLFMSKTIVEKSLNGSLTVRNTATGSEFRIVL
jgi:C4-dicarboxylate-specific signal transduction histidine kinase